MENQTTQEIRYEVLNYGWRFYQGKVTVYDNVNSKVLWVSDSATNDTLRNIFSDYKSKVVVEHKDGSTIVTQWFRLESVEITMESEKGLEYLYQAMKVFKVSDYTRKRVRKAVLSLLDQNKAPVVYIDDKKIVVYPMGHREEGVEFRYFKA